MDKRIKTINGNALNELGKLKSGSIDLIVTDPPYNLGKNYGNNNDSLGKAEYIEFTKAWIKEAVRILKPNGSLYIFMGVRFISHLYLILEEDFNLKFNSWIVWNYTQGMGKTKGFSPRHEDILFFNKSNTFTFNNDVVKVPQMYYRQRNNMRGANPGDVWKFSHIHYSNPNRQNHPTQKPEGLIERIILASSNPKEIVLDPFSGSGTTQRVCQQLDRECIGIELNLEYVEMTNARLKEPFTGFDSIDERMLRIPADLRNREIRNAYLANHFNWFLKNHPSSLPEFYKSISDLYGKEALLDFQQGQISLFGKE